MLAPRRATVVRFGVTTRPSSPILCECGHQGYLHLWESDYPFGPSREEYSLQGFEGQSITIMSYQDAPDNVLLAMNAKCPKCGQTGKVNYANRP